MGPIAWTTALMRHGCNPDSIRQFQKADCVEKTPQDTLAQPGGAVWGKRLGHLGDPLHGLFNLGDEVIP